MIEYELRFHDGPAKGRVIKMFVAPTRQRWFLQRGRVSWWTLFEPPEDHTARITRYRLAGSGRRALGGHLMIYEMAGTRDRVNDPDDPEFGVSASLKRGFE